MSIYLNEIKKIKKNPDKIPLTTDLNRKSIFLISAKSSKENVKLITKWRRQNWQGFLTKFKVTEQGTKKWLENISQNPSRILFFINYNNKKIGHIGFHRYDKKNKKVDIDSVLKAVRVNSPKIMENVLHVLFNWGFNDLKLSKIQLRVFSDNYKAINLYERSGMITIKSTPIKKIITNDGWIWKEVKFTKNKIAQRYMNTMEINKKSFCSQFGKNSET